MKQPKEAFKIFLSSYLSILGLAVGALIGVIIALILVQIFPFLKPYLSYMVLGIAIPLSAYCMYCFDRFIRR